MGEDIRFKNFCTEDLLTIDELLTIIRLLRLEWNNIEVAVVRERVIKITNCVNGCMSEFVADTRIDDKVVKLIKDLTESLGFKFTRIY